VNIATLRKSGWIASEYVAGSHAYGTATPASDRDTRGIFVLPLKERTSIRQISSSLTLCSKKL